MYIFFYNTKMREETQQKIPARHKRHNKLPEYNFNLQELI